MARFHRRDGRFFNRLPDGSVEIYQEREQVVNQTSARLDKVPFAVIPPAEWASIVSSVSKDGETGERFRAAAAFHGNPFEDKKPEPKTTPAAPAEPMAATDVPAADPSAPPKRPSRKVAAKK